MAAREVQPLASVVGSAIVAHRKKLGMSQIELADELGVGADSLSRIEKGLVAPRFARLEKIASILDCAVADLFRVQSDSLRTRSDTIADIIRPLSPELQDEVVALMAHTVQILKKKL